MSPKIAVVAASGIGDALILHTVSHHLQTLGYDVTTFSNHLPSFGKWLTGYKLAPQPQMEEIHTLFSTFDSIFLQHDNSPKARKILELPKQVYALFGSHLASKHGAYRFKLDYICNPKHTMVQNVLAASEKFFGSGSKETGLKTPPGIIHKKHKRRVAIHPTSSSELKNWPKENFLEVARILKNEGYDPVFTVSPKERAHWEGAPLFSTLAELASFLFESGAFLGNDSGLGHIASYLKIPHLIIGPSKEHLTLWRPGWYKGESVYAPPWVLKWKWSRERWKSFITIKKVTNKLIYTVLRN